MGDRSYRYGAAARRRAGFLLILTVLVFVLLLVALIAQWSRLDSWTRLLAGVLTIIVATTIRSQFVRMRLELRFTPDAAELHAPSANRRVPWSSIQAARQLGMPQLRGERRWACTVYVPNRRGRALPVLLFDSQLEAADEAWAQVVARTPQAVHQTVSGKTEKNTGR